MDDPPQSFPSPPPKTHGSAHVGPFSFLVIRFNPTGEARISDDKSAIEIVGYVGFVAIAPHRSAVSRWPEWYGAMLRLWNSTS